MSSVFCNGPTRGTLVKGTMPVGFAPLSQSVTGQRTNFCTLARLFCERRFTGCIAPLSYWYVGIDLSCRVAPLRPVGPPVWKRKDSRRGRRHPRVVLPGKGFQQHGRQYRSRDGSADAGGLSDHALHGPRIIWPRLVKLEMRGPGPVFMIQLMQEADPRQPVLLDSRTRAE